MCHIVKRQCRRRHEFLLSALFGLFHVLQSTPWILTVVRHCQLRTGTPSKAFGITRCERDWEQIFGNILCSYRKAPGTLAKIAKKWSSWLLSSSKSRRASSARTQFCRLCFREIDGFGIGLWWRKHERGTGFRRIRVKKRYKKRENFTVPLLLWSLKCVAHLLSVKSAEILYFSQNVGVARFQKAFNATQSPAISYLIKF